MVCKWRVNCPEKCDVLGIMGLWEIGMFWSYRNRYGNADFWEDFGLCCLDVSRWLLIKAIKGIASSEFRI